MEKTLISEKTSERKWFQSTKIWLRQGQMPLAVYCMLYLVWYYIWILYLSLVVTDLIEVGLKPKMFATCSSNSSFGIKGKSIKWPISGDVIVICKVNAWWPTILSGLAVISTSRNGDKAINVCHVTYWWQYHCHMQGIVSTSWCTILPSLIAICLVDILEGTKP